METYRYECNGEVWEVRSGGCVRHKDIPCRQIDLHGNIETYHGESVIVIDSQPLADGYVRYWLVETNPDLQSNTVRIVELEEALATRRS